MTRAAMSSTCLRMAGVLCAIASVFLPAEVAAQDLYGYPSGEYYTKGMLCGPYCLMEVNILCGRPSSLKEILEETDFDLVRDKGLSMDVMEKYLRSRQVPALAIQLKNTDDLRKCREWFIAHMMGNHYVLVKYRKDGMLVTVDYPDTEVVSDEEFKSKASGNVLLLFGDVDLHKHPSTSRMTGLFVALMIAGIFLFIFGAIRSRGLKARDGEHGVAR